MRRSLFSLYTLLFLSACGQGFKSNSAVSKVELGSELISSENFTSLQKNVALRICNVYRSKNYDLRENHTNKTFKYTVNYKNCSGTNVKSSTTMSTILRQVLLMDPMVYDSTETIPYMKYVETNAHGKLVDVCEKLFEGNDPFLSIDLNSEQKQEIIFSSGTDNDHYAVIIATKDSSGKYLVNEDHRYYVDTTSSVPNPIGLVTKYTFKKACSETIEETFSQELQN